MIHILTIHYGVNYGSALQTYALFTFLSRNDKTDVINYIPERYHLWNHINGPSYKNRGFLFKIIHFIVKAPINICQRRIFSSFISENVNITEKIKNIKSISSYLKDGDILVIGSDQVWNTDYNGYTDTTYLCGFNTYNVRKVSYAASIGKDFLSEEDKALFRKYLSSFAAISLREATGKKILSELGINCTVVLDPTFLLTRKEWEELSSKKYCDENYILIYVMDNEYEKLFEVASELSQREGWHIYAVTFRKTGDKRANKEFINATPEEFLGLLSKSKYVITNSFHGTAFSINMNKQFISIGKKSYNSRMRDLLNYTGIEGHYFNPKDSIEIDKISEINYSEVNARIDGLRKQSIAFINENIVMDIRGGDK